MQQSEWSDQTVKTQAQEPQHLDLVSSSSARKYDVNQIAEDYGQYQTTFDQENYKRFKGNQYKKYPAMLPDQTNSRSNEDNVKVRDSGFGGSRTTRRKKKQKNKYFLQDRRLLAEKYYPQEKYLEPLNDYYEDNFYDDLEVAYNEPVNVNTIQPVVENRQFTTVG